MLDDLTAEQRAAVTHPGGPLLVVAGAGAGKTGVLCRRLAWLVEQGVAPDEVLALTFSARAAEELRARAEDTLGRAHETLRVTTFHSYAGELVRVHGVERGLLPPTSYATDEDRTLFLLERLAELDLIEHDLRGDAMGLIGDLLERINRCKDELVAAEDFRRWAEEAVGSARNAGERRRRQRDLEFARAYEAHDRWLAEAGRQDFGESLVRALNLLRAHPDRLAAAQLGARHILVDEFQDTNHAQAELLYLLAQGAESIVAVGDDDQGIYRFRGASTKNIADFRARFPGLRELRLELNHRSTQAILDAAHAVVAPLAGRAEKRLVARAGAAGPVPRFWRAPDEAGQARAVADEIARLAREEGIPFEEQAILMRAVRTEGRPVVEALERAGIPYQVHGGVGLFERRDVRAALAWLRALTDPADAQAHLRLAADPLLGLPWPAAADAVAGGGAVTEALVSVAREAGAPRLEELVDELGRTAATASPTELVREVLDRTGVRSTALALGGAEGAARLEGLAAFERLARDIAARDPGLDAAGLTAKLVGLAEVGFRGKVNAAERLGVQVTTVHSAKGLEFDAVFVVGLVQSRWPGKNRPGPDIPDALLPESLPRGTDAHVAEARRLAYVAMTRPRRYLVLCTLEAGEWGAQRPAAFYEEARGALGEPEPVSVGAGPERARLREIGVRRQEFEQASLQAAQAIAAGGPQAETLVGEVERAARVLVEARAAAMRAPVTAQVVVPPRPPRPGLSLSPTDIALYRQCPLKYRYARVDRVPQRSTPSAAVGMAAHSALEAHHRPGGSGGDGRELVRQFAGALHRLGAAETPEGRQALARAREWFPRYHERTGRSGVRPVAVERPFTLPIGPHRVSGRVDRVDAHPAGGYRLVDYKTGRTPRENGRAEGDLVLTLYLAGAREGWGIDARGASVEYVLDGDVIPVNPEPAEVKAALRQVLQVADAIHERRFDPEPGWHCRSCDFALLCPAQDR